MSWFTELTLKAEEMLNKIDENAAVMLNNPKGQKKDFTSVNLSEIISESNSTSQEHITNNTSDVKRRTNVNDISMFAEENKNFNVTAALKNNALKKDDDSLTVQILQSEIQTLTHEMSLLMHRVRLSELESSDLKSQLEIMKHQNEILQDEIYRLSNDNVHTDTQISKDSENTLSFLYNNHHHSELYTESDIKENANLRYSETSNMANLTTGAKKLELSESNNKSEHNHNDGKDIRIQALMKSVTDKQTALELITAEKTALEFQLDLLRRKHYELLNSKSSVTFSVNDTDDAKAQLPNFLRESPLDTRVARHVKKAYSSIDSISIRAGMCLRRYPLFRISAFFYVILMHVWVLLVLFSYMPDTKS